MCKSIARFWLLLAIIAIFFETGLCIRCYQCSSKTDPKCADPISSELEAMECSPSSVSTTIGAITFSLKGLGGISGGTGSSYSCVKVSSIYSNQIHNMTLIRGCYYGIPGDRDICSMVSSKIGDSSLLPFCETCQEDACNGSNRIASISLLSMLLPLGAFYAIMRQ